MATPESAKSLDDLGVLYGTDKSSICHDYLNHYAKAFAPYRPLPINVIEVGVFNGASAKMWQAYFPYATIIGIDIQERCRAYADDRIVIEIGSQIDPEFLDDVVRRYPPTIVIDDGSHQPPHQNFTFKHLFPRVLPGGFYVIEDLHIHSKAFADETTADGIVWPPDFLAGLAKYKLDYRLPAAFDNDEWRRLAHTIASVQAIHGAAIVEKRDDHEPTVEDLNWLEALTSIKNQDFAWVHLANYIQRLQKFYDRGLSAAQKAAALKPDVADHHESLGRIYQAMQNWPAALQAYDEAERLTIYPAQKARIAARRAMRPKDGESEP